MIFKPSLSECGIQENGEMLTAFRNYVLDEWRRTINPFKISRYSGTLETISDFLLECAGATQVQAQAFKEGIIV